MTIKIADGKSASGRTITKFDEAVFMLRFKPVLIRLRISPTAEAKTEFDLLLADAYRQLEDMATAGKISATRSRLTHCIRRVRLAYWAIGETPGPKPFVVGTIISHRTDRTRIGTITAVHVSVLGRYYMVLTEAGDSVEIFEAQAVRATLY